MPSGSRFHTGFNMNAWIDCMTSLDDPQDSMTTIHASSGDVLVLDLSNARDFAKRCPELFTALVESSAFVNYRRIKIGEEPILCLSFA